MLTDKELEKLIEECNLEEKKRSKGFIDNVWAALIELQVVRRHFPSANSLLEEEDESLKDF